MAISRFKTSTLAQGLPKYQDVWDGISAVDSSDFELITRTTLSSTTSTVTFSSIPSTYRHLQVRYIARDTSSTVDCNSVLFRFNSDSGSNYSRHYLLGTGNSGAYSGYVSQTGIDAGLDVGGGFAANNFGAGVVDILDYANSARFKSVKTLSGASTNASTPINYVEFQVGQWRSTTAINAIEVSVSGTSLAANSSFALYGIKGAS